MKLLPQMFTMISKRHVQQEVPAALRTRGSGVWAHLPISASAGWRGAALLPARGRRRWSVDGSGDPNLEYAPRRKDDDISGV